MPHTYDRLASPDHRDITTTWTTPETNKDGTVEVVLSTHFHNKRLITTLHTQTHNPQGFLVRSFAIFGPDSADRGVDLARTPMPRFSQKVAREQHESLLTNLAVALSPYTGQPHVVRLAQLLDLATQEVAA